MNSIRRTFIIATCVAAMGAASAAFAGLNAGMMDQINSSSSQSSSPAPSYSAPASSAPSSAPSYSSGPSYSPSPASSSSQRSSPQPNYRNNPANVGRQSTETRVQPAAPGPRPAAPASAQREPESRPNFRNSERLYSAPSSTVRPQASSGSESGSNSGNSESRKRSGVIGGAVSRNYTPDSPGGGGHHNGGNPGNHDNDNDHDGDHHHPRPPSVVYVLPPYYQDYYWNDSLYYNFNGGWYSPYGGVYMSVGTPYGLFMRSLPGYSSSFYYGNMRYYERDNTYYTYDRSRGGYVVTPSPYNEEDENYEYDDAVDEDIYVYPAQGQSEQQQADDRYACHRWGVKESGYDPIDDEYDRDRRGNYLRAMTACLTGRGYTVK